MKLFLYVLLIAVFISSPPLCPVQAEDAISGGTNENEIQVPPPIPDEAVKERLSIIFAEIPPFSGIEVDVRNGVVTLRGTVPSADDISEVTTLTHNTWGVVYVRNELETTAALGTRLSPAFEMTEELLRSGIRKLPLILIAIAIVAFFWLMGSWISKRERWLKIFRLNELSAGLFQRFLKLLSIGLGTYIALEILDATALAGAILGVAGVVGIALGFAFRNIVENYLSGILLSIRNPFATGDAVQIEGFTGKVMRLTSRDTVLMTFDGNHLRIPNSKIITSTMLNFTRNPLRRLDFSIGVAVGLNLRKARELAVETLLSLESVLADPKPMIIIEELGESTVNMRLFAWIDQRESDYLKSRSEAIRFVKEAFDEAGIEMPEPIYRVNIRNSGALTEDPQGPEEPEERKREKPDPTEVDVANDHAIDKQVAQAQLADREPNLLKD